MIGPPALGAPAQTCAWIEPPLVLNVTVEPAPAEYVGQVPLTVGSLVGVVAFASSTPPELPLVAPLELLLAVAPEPLEDPGVSPVPLLDAVPVKPFEPPEPLEPVAPPPA